ncbi:unnamed protein product [Phytophthora lilii]|uniref:Unnamed protein product n=1 Tax=Phytophthora lilii TaxID=2077276 RepID=A0A9W7DCC3_9STRA|nr:unnamed protein product [Phytophthora lilii]
MDALDLLIGGFRDAAPQEEKREDNPSDAEDVDMDFPSTQLLPQADREPPRSPAKARASPAKPRNSPAKPRSSPAKVRSSPVKNRASPAKTQSPAKIRSPPKPRSSPAKAPKAAPSPIVERLARQEKKEEEVKDDTPEEFRAAGAEGKFTQVFPEVAKLVETGGWQIAQGHNTLFCAMPGVQFFNFKPNINVFDSKIKACWKFIQLAGEKKEDNEDQELWDMLWPIAEKEFGWFTMMCGPETWFVKPNTKFESFRPNETIFQTKKRAVLKCLAVEVGDIELGDSSEGHQIIAFAPREVPAPAPKKAKTALFKTPSPAVKRTTTPTSSSSTRFTTPASVASSAKRKLVSSASKSSASKKVKGGKRSAKKTVTKKRRKGISDTASDISKGDEFNFTPPEFKCTFGIVYSKLQDEGWYHKNGMFEYDYFSPTYTDATKELGVNYFQSQATFEDFLKQSGTWTRIEDELRYEHDQAVDVEREKALERHHQRLEQQAARKRDLALYRAHALPQHVPAAPTAPKPKPKKVKKAAPKKVASTPPVPQTLYEAEVEAAIAKETLDRMPKIKFGTVLKRLCKRGWYYRPGRFEYDYFKPNANPRTAESGEDRFESAAALEVYLKTSGLWEEIAAEIEHEELAKHDTRDVHRSDVSVERSVKRSRMESPPPASVPSPKKAVPREEVNELTNTIWANSHQFDFDE